MTDLTPSQRNWLERCRVLGKSQARYLTLLFVASLFYWTLHAQVMSAGSASDQVAVPVVGVHANLQAVWSTGPIVLAFLVLVLMGSIRAYGVAWKATGIDEERFEEHSLAPNPLDLAFYSHRGDRVKWVARVEYLAYPITVTIPLLEAGWLLHRVWTRVGDVRAGWFILGLGAVAMLAASYVVLILWVDRILTALRGKEAS